MDLTLLERAVLETLLSRDEPGYDELREQLTSCRVVSREMTGVGFYSTLKVDAATPPVAADVGNPLGTGHAFPDDIYAAIEGLEQGAGFVLWLDDGWLSQLEGFTYDEPWPDEIRTFTVRLAPSTRA
jgi:hypothetical protein